ncbi:hypothetical protein [Pandoraea oxalativorans]|nr:hypothetical protein [Pandoraea oxalativorans]
MTTTSTSAQRTGSSASVARRRHAGVTNLPAPTLPHLESGGGILDPNLPRTNVTVPVYDGKALDDLITLHWDAPVTGVYTDSVPVTTPNLGIPITFQVVKEEIKPNEGTTVHVFYTVSRNGVVVETSLPTDVPVGEQVAEPGDVEPPAIEGVAGGVLNLVMCLKQVRPPSWPPMKAWA